MGISPAAARARELRAEANRNAMDLIEFPPAYIADQCRKIQATWTPYERWRRQVTRPKPWEPMQEFHVAEVE